MITDEKLTVYQRFRGDVDGWARAATPHERALMTDGDWADISAILLPLAIVKSGLAADAYEPETRRIIAAKVENALAPDVALLTHKFAGIVSSGENQSGACLSDRIHLPPT